MQGTTGTSVAFGDDFWRSPAESQLRSVAHMEAEHHSYRFQNPEELVLDCDGDPLPTVQVGLGRLDRCVAQHELDCSSSPPA